MNRRTDDLSRRHITPADGNVFADLGFPPEKAAELLRDADAQIEKARVFGVKYKDWVLHLGRDSGEDGRIYMQWQFKAACAKTGEVCDQSGRKWYLSPHMTVSELVTTAFKAALTAEEHECRENFTWNGKRIFNPHVDVAALWDVCDQEDVRDEIP
jgi:hypothetical protein